MASAQVLIVEDMLDLSRTYADALEDLDVQVHFAKDLAQAREKLSEVQPSVAILDLNLPDGKGTDLIAEIKEQGIDCAAIVITAFVSITTAIDCLKAGAHDFIVKPFKTDKLVQSVRAALEPAEPRTVAAKAKAVQNSTKGQATAQNDFIGTSAAMRQVFASIEAVAPTEASVFITGETGTGKELCAHALHRASNRSDQDIVVLNCAAIPKELFESELFGHMKGSFTGATATKEGAAHQANGGTLFLDELGEMELSSQKKLLRFLQTGTFNRVGSTKLEKVDVRFVAATNIDPLLEIRRGNLRADLYHRLSVVPIEMPPLRQRGRDVIAIAESFIKQFSSVDRTRDLVLSDDAKQALLSSDWPGNVRQLQNVIRRVLIFTKGNEITAQDVRPHLAGEGSAAAGQGYGAPGAVQPLGDRAYDGQSRAFEHSEGAPLPAQEYASDQLPGSVTGHVPRMAEGSGSSNFGADGFMPLEGAQGFAASTAGGTLVDQGQMGPASFAAARAITPELFSQTIVPVAQLERMAIDGALKKFDGDVVCAAAALKISISSVYRKRTPVKRI